jgi:hypothetical protein
MTHHPEPASGIHRPNYAKSRRQLLIACSLVVATIIVLLWLWPAPMPDNRPSPVGEAPAVSDSELSADKAASIEPESTGAEVSRMNADPVATGPATNENEDMFSVGENNPEPLVDEFVPTAEQELLDQKTRMFIAEAKESLPLLDIRPFYPIDAARQQYEAKGTTDEEDDAVENEPRDLRGLKNGEVWIRIDPAYSAEYPSIMAQTADLYRVNTGYEGEIKVMLWVGGRPWASETYGAPW